MPLKRIYRKPPYKKTVYKKKTTTMPKYKTVRKIVKQVLDRRLENKEVTNVMQYFPIFQTGSTTIRVGQGLTELTPIIATGTGENGRIGNTVHLKNAFMRAVIAINPTLLDTRVPNVIGQWHVRLFIGKVKNSISSPTNTQLDNLLRSGGATMAFDSANGLSLCRTVNTEVFTVYYDKIHKIGFQNGNNQSVATGLHNNDFKLTKILKINCTKMYKKKLIFTEGQNTPTNNGLFMWAGLCDSMMSGYTASTALVNICYDMEFSYEDA